MNDRMTVVLQYPTHHYIETYVLTSMHCPGCGEQRVWMEDGVGDYYCGSNHVCAACGSEFTWQSGGEHPGLVEQLRSGKMATPIGPGDGEL